MWFYKEGHKATEEEIIAFCKDNIAHYKAPKSVDFIRELPKTASGKIHKKGLRDSTGGRRGKRSRDKNEGGSISRIHFSSVSHRFAIQTWDNQHLV